MRVNNLFKYLFFLIASFLVSCERDVNPSIEPPIKPSCSITSPANGYEVEQGKFVKIAVEINDLTDSDAEVSLLMNDKIEVVLQEPPYEFAWSTSQTKTGICVVKAFAKSKYHRTTETSIEINILPSQIEYGSVDDIEGNTYKTVKIGSQIWMAENLRTTTYADGTKIPLLQYGPDDFGLNNTDRAYIFYDTKKALNPSDEVINYTAIGALYNFAATINGDGTGNKVQGVCPDGWHVPSDNEWTILENYLADNGYNYDATIGGGREKIAKALASTTIWNEYSSPDKGNIGYKPSQNNASGFNAFPAGRFGYRFGGYGFSHYKEEAHWWSSTENGDIDAVGRFLNTDWSFIRKYDSYLKSDGFSVRCVKD